jgi:hypothetical protein
LLPPLLPLLPLPPLLPLLPLPLPLLLLLGWKLLVTACGRTPELLLLLLALLLVLEMMPRAVVARDVSTASLLMAAAMADEALPCRERACKRHKPSPQ